MQRNYGDLYYFVIIGDVLKSAYGSINGLSTLYDLVAFKSNESISLHSFGTFVINFIELLFFISFNMAAPLELNPKILAY